MSLFKRFKFNLTSYRIIYLCTCFTALVNAITFSLLGPFLPEYAEDHFKSSPFSVGVIMAMYPVFNLIASTGIGYIVNIVGQWGILNMGLLLLTFSTSLYGFAFNVGILILASALHGICLSMVHISSLSLLSNFPERLTEGSAGIEIWSGIGSIIGPPIGGLIYPHYGITGIFFCVSLFPLLVFISVLCMRIYVIDIKMLEKYDISSPRRKITMKSVASSKEVKQGAILTAFNYGIIGILESTFSPHLAQALHTDPSTVGFVFIIPSICYSLVAFKVAKLVAHFGTLNTMLVGFFVSSISLLLFGPSPIFNLFQISFETSRQTIAAGMLLLQVGSALMSVPAFPLMQGGASHLGKDADSIVASLHSLSIGIGEAVGPLLGGTLMELVGHTNIPGCITINAEIELKVSESHMLQNCLSAFPMTCTIISLISLLTLAAFVSSNRIKKKKLLKEEKMFEEKDFGGDISTMIAI